MYKVEIQELKNGGAVIILDKGSKELLSECLNLVSVFGKWEANSKAMDMAGAMNSMLED